MTVRGQVVFEAPPYWKVVRRLNANDQPLHPPKHPEAFAVIDTSVTPSRRVHGPADRASCEEFARAYSTTFHTLRGTFLSPYLFGGNGP